MKDVKIILVGMGVVGKGVAELLDEKRDFFRKKNFNPKVVAIAEKDGALIDGEGINLKDALKDLKKAGKWVEEKSINIVSGVEADVVIEVTPTNLETGEPGLSHIRKALKSGKHAITSNKGPLVVDFWGLKEDAEKNNVLFRYEATVCAAIPLFSLHRNSIEANRIEFIKGILNGTTNYILTKMHEDGIPFEVALEEAIESGYAEKNYSYDINGNDAAAKAVIIANAILGMKKKYSDVKLTGIGGVTKNSVELAKDSGFVIKLIAEIDENKLEVSPRLVPKLHPLNVNGTLNAVMFKMDMARDLYLVGRGAGKRETAGSIINDLVEIMRDESLLKK